MQPASELAFGSPSSEVHARHLAGPSGRREWSAVSDPSVVLAALSATVCQIRGLQQRHVGDVELESRLLRSAGELESLISHVLHMDSSESSPPATPCDSASTPRQRTLEQAFLVWLTEPSSANELLLDGAEGPLPLARVLGELSRSRRALPAETAAGFGLPGETTVGHVAAELLLAVKDPAGPRCRSFRAAVYYLRDLDRGRFIEPDDRKVGR